jgi:putative flippase GtrA
MFHVSYDINYFTNLYFSFKNKSNFRRLINFVSYCLFNLCCVCFVPVLRSAIVLLS